jgi:hypothetical protein
MSDGGDGGDGGEFWWEGGAVGKEDWRDEGSNLLARPE